jgi:uncharacterized OsmC-like protein
MRIVVTGETEIVVEPASSLEIEERGHAHFGPLHMLAASLATCTVAVFASWSEAAGLGLDDLRIRLRWDYVDGPYRVGAYRMEIIWPSLPPERRERAQRVAEACTVHHTLVHPPAIDIGFGS